jgi:tyrosyl-tRNA synthetase
VQDADIKRFLLLFTFLPLGECEQLCAAGTNPNTAKERLAYEVTALIHGKDEAERALAGAKAAFGSGGGGSADRSAMPSKELSRAKFEAGYNIVDLFADAGLCPTKSESRRLVEQGGAFVAGADGALAATNDVKAQILIDAINDGELVIRAGKKRYCRVVVV